MSQKFANFPSLKEKTVFVTGGASGIGAEIVSAFVAQGAKVGFLDLDTSASQNLSDTLGGNVQFEVCDLCNITALKNAMDQLTER